MSMTGPEKKFRAGGCTASVFVNQFQTPEGMRTAKNVVLERTYRDKSGTYPGRQELQHERYSKGDIGFAGGIRIYRVEPE